MLATQLPEAAYFVLSDDRVSHGDNFLPNDKILDSSKLRAFADDEVNLTDNLKIVLERVENLE